MRAFRQTTSVVSLNLRGLRARLGTSLEIVVGVACVVGVLLSVLSFSAGLAGTIRAASDPDRAIIVAKGDRNEFGAGISRETAAAIMNTPGVRKDTDGAPIASAEQLTNVPLTRKSDGVPAGTVLRSVGDKAFVLRPELRLVAGRKFERGAHELIVGAAAQAAYQGLELGDRVGLPGGEWTVVGVFETGGDMIEGQLLGDSDTVLPAIGRNGYGSVLVRLESPDAFARFAEALTRNPALNVDVRRQGDFYRRTPIGQFTTFMAAVAYMLAGIMAVGALFATLNTMYSAVRARRREIATLRALGFGAMPVAASVVAEALLLALIGALLGAAIATLLFSGNRNVMGPYVFQLSVTPALVAVGITWAIVIALIGGLFPAIRASRVPVATGLRAT
jgi:putative ABC transport system permease protein